MPLEPPDRSATPYQRLGLGAPRFGLDDKELERAWLQASRTFHPDRFATKDDRERRFAAEHTIAINEAYRALKDPYDRAAWLLRSAGVDVAGLDQALLVELMELREEAELSAAKKAEVSARAAGRFMAAKADVAARLAKVDAEPAGYARPSEQLRQVARRLAEMKTLARLVDDLGGGRLITTLDGR